MHDLVHLCHHRWTIPVLGALGEVPGGRYAWLRHRLNMPRETLRRAISWLIDEDYVLANPGYGHPLRPELLLTTWGEAVAGACGHILALSERSGGTWPVIGRKWSLPVLVSIFESNGRHGQIASYVDECSPRALSQTLHVLEDEGLLVREIVEQRPVRVEYRLTKLGRKFAQAGLELGVRVSEV